MRTVSDTCDTCEADVVVPFNYVGSCDESEDDTSL
jgi:hypothetical protein